jgi:hypothetical protein
MIIIVLAVSMIGFFNAFVLARKSDSYMGNTTRIEPMPKMDTTMPKMEPMPKMDPIKMEPIRMDPIKTDPLKINPVELKTDPLPKIEPTKPLQHDKTLKSSDAQKNKDAL